MAPRQQQIKDRLVRNNAEDRHDSMPVSGAQYIRWNGDNSKGLVTITRNLEQPRQPMRFENPMHDQIVRLHPIEVQITPFAIHQMPRFPSQSAKFRAIQPIQLRCLKQVDCWVGRPNRTRTEDGTLKSSILMLMNHNTELRHRLHSLQK